MPRRVPEAVVARLLASPEPAIRWMVRSRVLGEAAEDDRAAIPGTDMVRRMVAGAGSQPYAKWQGAHWVLAALAEIGHPPGSENLIPLREQALRAWLDDQYFREVPVAYGRRGVPVLNGRYRAHASQQGYALWYLLTLGLADERCDSLAGLLLKWRWPDGGWNCDRDPAASTSSFMETLLPMRGLWLYGTTRDSAPAREAARAAAEVFLARRMAYGVKSGSLIRGEFAKLHFPLYWHYDILGGLKAMGEMGLLGDPRCADALAMLESMRLEDGWPAHARYYRDASENADWGGTSVKRASPWVTVDALTVLRAARPEGLPGG
ncbi:hypothetical protein ACIA5D_21365 [Actinoplanes sp. NPDC051513]|uniref:hypothetical protein n=1 Tax=Actinoplanes sp. NPDC051513 TaxID=3363908 RepID=UPI003788F87D